MGDSMDRKNQHKLSLKKDLQDINKVDEIARNLNSFSTRFFGWVRDDYNYYKDLTCEMIEGVVNETNEMIDNLDFTGIRGRFAILEQIQTKLKKHFHHIPDPGVRIKRNLSQQASKL